MNAGGEEFRRLPTFYQVDLRADHRWVFDAFTLEGYVELVNATLTRQVLTLNETPNGVVAQDSFRIVLPSIGLHAEF